MIYRLKKFMKTLKALTVTVSAVILTMFILALPFIFVIGAALLFTKLLFF